MDSPFLAQYKAQFRETPNVAIFADEDSAFAKMRAGYKPDVMGPCFYEYPRWQEAGLLQPIDTTKLRNWSKISPTLPICIIALGDPRRIRPCGNASFSPYSLCLD